MSRRVRRNALVEASEPHQKERLGLLSVNEKDLGTVKRPSTRLLAKRRGYAADETSGVALRNGVPTYQVEDEEGRTHLLAN